MTKQTILIADDDRDLLKIEEAFLTRAGYSVLCAQDAYRAFHLAMSEKPGLVLLDVNMPAGNGLSVHKRILTAPAIRDTPVIYLTGQKSDAIVESAREMGAFAILYKPLNFEVLLTNVKTAIREFEMRKSAAVGSAKFGVSVAWAVQTASA